MGHFHRNPTTPERKVEIERSHPCTGCDCEVCDLLTALREAQQSLAKAELGGKVLQSWYDSCIAERAALSRRVENLNVENLRLQAALREAQQEKERYAKMAGHSGVIIAERDALSRRVEMLGETIRKIGAAVKEACRDAEAALRGEASG